VPNALRRILAIAGATALLLGLGASLGASAPANAAEDVPIATTVTPVDGSTVLAEDATLTWTSSGPAGSYEVRWGTTDEVGADSLLIADGSASGLTEPRFDIPDPADLEYHWQVRAIGLDGSAGPWSAPSSFTMRTGSGEGEQLDTLPHDSADAPGAKPARPPGAGNVDGILYLLVASSFAVLLLAVVARAWLRERRAA
jgi:hypothetical protein